MKASLDKVVKIAEIIGSLGIVISLIFVSIQYQNNSLALQTSTANSVNANIATLLFLKTLRPQKHL